MKNKSLFLRMVIAFGFVAVPMLSLATTLKIVNIAPNNTIRVGSRECHIGDTINLMDTIHWDHTSENQTIKVICKKDCPEEYKKIRVCSKRENEHKSGIDLSFADIKGMVSKGEENLDPIILWPGELILIRGVQPEKGYAYYCRIQGDLQTFDLVITNEGLCINSDDFKDLGVEITLDIYKKSLTNVGDISIITTIEVEQAK